MHHLIVFIGSMQPDNFLNLNWSGLSPTMTAGTTFTEAVFGFLHEAWVRSNSCSGLLVWLTGFYLGPGRGHAKGSPQPGRLETVDSAFALEPGCIDAVWLDTVAWMDAGYKSRWSPTLG
jgi:hypothetical protein